jgi:serine/threonine-protein kinase TTK/MPS1
MERRDNFLRPPAAEDTGKSVTFPSVGDTSNTNLSSSTGSSSSSLTLDPPDFLSQVHAACKRQRPLGEFARTLPSFAVSIATFRVLV